MNRFTAALLVVPILFSSCKGAPPPFNASGGRGGAVAPASAGGPPNAASSLSGAAAGEGERRALEWLPSWATTLQSMEPKNRPPELRGNTLRQFVWPTISGSRIRIQLSNERGRSPLEIRQVHIARAGTGGDSGDSQGAIDTATDAAFTFGGGTEGTTIPAGGAIWSDPLGYSLQELALTAVSMQFGEAVPPEITGHPGSRTTSYVAEGEQVASQGMAPSQTRDRWYFISAIEVMAPADAYAIAVLGDSITDGYGVLNRFARWPDFLTLAIKKNAKLSENRSVLNFGMGANNLTVSGRYQDAGLKRFERDVLGRKKIKWLVLLEGINDIVYSNVAAQPIQDAYTEIVSRAHAAGILVYGSPLLPTDRGSAAIRNAVNDFVRTEALFDAVIPLDRAVDPTGAGILAAPFDKDGLHPNEAGYQAMGNAVDLSLFYDGTLR